MFTAYTNLPNDARLWIYQSNREFTEKEVAYIAIKSEDFILDCDDKLIPKFSQKPQFVKAPYLFLAGDIG